MKSKYILLILFIIISPFVHAQIIGIKGGINFAGFNDSNDKNGFFEKSVTGLHAGPVVDYALTERLFLNSGLLYSLKGTMINSISNNGIQEYVPLKISNLDIPLNLSYRFPFNEKSFLFIQGGPYVGYVLSGRLKIEGNYQKVPMGKEGQLRRFDFGFNIGPGIQLGRLGAQINYDLGLYDRFDSPGVNTKNRILQLSLFYMLHG